MRARLGCPGQALRDSTLRLTPALDRLVHSRNVLAQGNLVYARRPRTSPPLVVRADNPADLRIQITRAESKTA
jgi:hypothetical protein